jgi:dienelactone hydrolase
MPTARAAPWILVAAMAIAALAPACDDSGGGPAGGSDPTLAATPTGVTGGTGSEASPTAAPEPGEPVRFRALDGVRIVGRVFGSGSVAVVLAHQSDQTQSAWAFYAQELAAEGYTALTFTFRGYCGEDERVCSEDGSAGTDGWRDVAGAVAYLRDRGAERVYATGASLGGAAVLRAVAEGAPVDGAAMLSGIPDTPAELDALRPGRIGVPLLFVVGRLDGGLASDVRAVYGDAPEPKRLEILPTGEHGTALLRFAEDALQARVREALLELYGAP